MAVKSGRESISRRSVLMGAAACAATVTGGLVTAAPAGQAEKSVRKSSGRAARADYDVIVVGGGMAGVSAAREVSRSGLRTLLLEGRNRLGGRTFYSKFAGRDVELGANYLYWLQPHIWAEVERYALPIDDTPAAVNPDRWIFLRDGKAVEADVKTLGPKLDQALAEYCSKSREVFPLPYDPYATDAWKPYAGLSIQDRIDQMKLEPDVRLNLNAVWSIMSHARNTEGGFLEMLRWWANLGNNAQDFNAACSRYRLKRGTISLIESIIGDARAEVVLGAPVVRIEQKNGKVRVTTDAGQTVTAKRVILATPLNTWVDVAFEPKLSDLKLKVSKERHVGNGNKLHVKTRQNLGNVFLTADDSFGPLQYGYTEESGSDGTMLLSYGWDGSFDVNNLEKVTALMRKFLPEVDVVDCYGYQWSLDPFSRGTWCTLRPHQFALVPQLQNAEGNVHFATADIATMWRGWMDGGIEMGIKVGHVVSRALA